MDHSKEGLPTKTIEDAKAHCRFVGEGIEKDVAAWENLGERFERTPMLRFKIERDGGKETAGGGEPGGDDSGIVVSETVVTKLFGDGIVGYAFNEETREAMIASRVAARMAGSAEKRRQSKVEVSIIIKFHLSSAGGFGCPS